MDWDSLDRSPLSARQVGDPRSGEPFSGRVHRGIIVNVSGRTARASVVWVAPRRTRFSARNNPVAQGQWR